MAWHRASGSLDTANFAISERYGSERAKAREVPIFIPEFWQFGATDGMKLGTLM
jgi:hypothetical protein